MTGHARPGQPEDPERMDRATLLRYVRAWVEHRLKDTSLRDLAAEIGIPKSSLALLAVGDRVAGKNWPKLRLWYLADRRRNHYSPQNAATMALLAQEMVANVPAGERPRALAGLVEALAAIHSDTCAPWPEWLVILQASAGASGSGDEEP